MDMKECTKFHTCSAPLCPLDPDVFKRAYLRDEPVCFYIREFVKAGAKERFKNRGGTVEYLYFSISKILPSLLSRYAPFRIAVKRASRTGSKWDSAVAQNKKQENMA